MKSAIRQGLLCILIGTITASITKAQLTTPRYNNVTDENLNFTDSFEPTLLSKPGLLRSFDYFYIYVTGNANPRMLKLHANSMNSTSHLVNSSLSYFIKNNKKYINTFKLQNVTPYQPNVVGNENNLRNKTVNTGLTMRPKVKYKKQYISEPITTTPNKNLSRALEKLNKIEPIKVVSGTSSVTVQLPVVKPVDSRTIISNLKMSHKAEPMRKESIDTPAITKYTPEIFTNNTRPLTSLPNFQHMFFQVRPQIYTHSPEYSINNLSSESQNFTSASVDLNQSHRPLPMPASQVIVQSMPSGNIGTKDSLQTDCPSFLLNSNVFGPERQGCSDLSIVINSHLNQNVITEAAPEVLVDEVQSDESAVDTPTQLASPAADVQPSPAAAPAAAPETSPSQSTSGGNPGAGLPQLPSLPELSLPDLKGLFDLLGVIWRIVSPVLRFFTNPYLYLVPAGISFALGFMKIIGVFKLFIVVPALLLFGYINKDKSPEVAYYKHVHKPIHHDDGWFWNHNTKMWNNVVNYKHQESSFRK